MAYTYFVHISLLSQLGNVTNLLRDFVHFAKDNSAFLAIQIIEESSTHQEKPFSCESSFDFPSRSLFFFGKKKERKKNTHAHSCSKIKKCMIPQAIPDTIIFEAHFPSLIMERGFYTCWRFICTRTESTRPHYITIVYNSFFGFWLLGALPKPKDELLVSCDTFFVFLIDKSFYICLSLYLLLFWLLSDKSTCC